MKLYTFGYQRRRPEELVAEAERLEAIVVDVRLKPFSRAKGWSKGPLSGLLGERYVHLPALGNVNYKDGGDIRLQDEEQGLAELHSLLEEQPAILLCYEAEPEGCHRTYIANLAIQEWGVEVEHLVKVEVQPTLI